MKHLHLLSSHNRTEDCQCGISQPLSPPTPLCTIFSPTYHVVPTHPPLEHYTTTQLQYNTQYSPTHPQCKLSTQPPKQTSNASSTTITALRSSKRPYQVCVWHCPRKHKQEIKAMCTQKADQQIDAHKHQHHFRVLGASFLTLQLFLRVANQSVNTATSTKGEFQVLFVCQRLSVSS